LEGLMAKVVVTSPSTWVTPAMDGLAVKPLASGDYLTAPAGSCSVAPLAKPRLSALLSTEMIEWRVERNGGCHPHRGVLEWRLLP
jgi:hypothetical protein